MLPDIGAELAGSMDVIRIAPEATMKISHSNWGEPLTGCTTRYGNSERSIVQDSVVIANYI